MAYRTDPSLKITRGDSGDYARFRFTVTENTVAVNVTGRTFYMSGKRSLSDAIPFFLCSTAEGDVSYTNAATGVIVIRLRAEDTQTLQAETSLYCDVQMTDSFGTVTLDTFMLLVEMDVTEVYT